MPIAYFVVRATVTDPPNALRSMRGIRTSICPTPQVFDITKARRFWSASDPSLHMATYEFPDLAALERGTGGDTMKPLVDEFERCWPGVTRTREVLVLAGEFGA